MSSAIPTLEEKCRGAMLATAIGDALGWPQEIRCKNRNMNSQLTGKFVDWIRVTNNPRWHNEKILAGEYSDDTQLTLSVARSVITEDWENWFAKKELPFWLRYERGGGRALLKAAKSCSQNNTLLWQTKSPKIYFNAGGNGAAMRILPHVIVSSKNNNTTALMLDIIKDTLITHGHPRAFLGAMCYAYALDYLSKKKSVLEFGELIDTLIDERESWTLKPDYNYFGNWLNIAFHNCGYNFMNEWDDTVARMLEKLEVIKAFLKKGLMSDDEKMLTELECFGKASGAGDVAALTAVYIASKYANNPELAIRTAAYSMGSDTDTIASMTGGLIGMFNGTDWIPNEWRNVQDYDCLITMSDLLLSSNKINAVESIVSPVKMTNSDWESTPIGKMRQVGSNSVPNGKNGQVIIKKWQTALGQTLYTKYFQPADHFSQYRQNDMQSTAPQDKLCNLNTTYEKGVQIQMSDLKEDVKNEYALGEKNGKEKRQFVLDVTNIENFITDPRFKQSITIGKILKIIQALMEDRKSNTAIAKQFKVDQTMVDLLKNFIKN